MSLRFLPVFMFLIVCAVSPDGAAANRSQCATVAEKQAFDMRAMQSDLMVAALSCNKRDVYNRFMTSYGVSLKDNSRTLRGYFQRVSAGNVESQMNKFVTQLANTSSEYSLDMQRSEYCKNAGIVFNMLLSGANPQRISRHFAPLHNVAVCGNVHVASR